MRREEFIDRYGAIYEHSEWVAAETYAAAGDECGNGRLAALFAQCVDNAPDERKLTLIRAHPDLAGRAAIAGELTDASNVEQSSAGIDQCTPAEFSRFQELNERYKRKFNFPFVMAVRNSNRHAILAAFEARLQNEPAVEFARAIAEIHKIAKLRLEAMNNR
jgi:OHCU decarboxylase